MIVTEFYKGQGLGNQLWCYVVTRVIAEDLGYDFGIEHPERFKGADFLNLDFGKTPEGIKHHYVERQLWHRENGADIREYDKNLVNVPDDTKIDGVMQDEQYIMHRKEEIRQWLEVKSEYGCYDFSRDTICIINFRGGEYAQHPELFLTRKYWNDAVENMKKINSGLKFVVITDDTKTAKKFFPDYDVFHFDIAKDYSIIKNAYYLILSNSSFAWFPAWLNQNLKYCIAPKYWARHNVSDGYWSCGYNITTLWMYQDRNGMLFDYKTCLRELDNYRKSMKTLDEIALNYGTDKSSLSHNYTKLYALYFENLRHEKLKMLEIGIDKGHSLKSWKEYFPSAEITGIDILDLKHFEEDRIHVLQGDQSDQEFLKKVNTEYGPFDIIIDDGSHHNDHMKASFECLFPLLKPGGVYVVEDLHACYWNKSHGTGEPVFIDLLKKIMDDVNAGGKSGTADRTHDKDDAWYIQQKISPMSWWEENVEFIHLYRSIVFIKKYPPDYHKYLSNKKERYLTVNDIRPPVHKDKFFKRIFFRTARKAKRMLKRIKKYDSR